MSFPTSFPCFSHVYFQVVEDFPGVVTPPYSPPTTELSPPSSVATPPTSSAPQPVPVQPLQASLPTTITAQNNAAKIISPQSKPVSHKFTSTGPQKPLPLPKQQPAPSVNPTSLDTGLASLCQQIGLPHFNGMSVYIYVYNMSVCWQGIILFCICGSQLTLGK